MPAPKLTITHWLIIVIASIGFLFDTYELLMTPLVAGPAISELLKIAPNNPIVTDWVGRLLWISALSGGIFGLLGGWLVDKFGRKTVMALSILVYAASPFAAAYATTLPMFIFFRSTTFIGVCVEFVAAITWLAEVFEDRKQKERWLGISQAFASLGGVAVTIVSAAIRFKAAPEFPAFDGGAVLHSIGAWAEYPFDVLAYKIVGLAKSVATGLPVGQDGQPAFWRYLLITGLTPALPIVLLLPFVPESKVWKARRASGTLQRPSFGALFAPGLCRITVVTAILSACAYGIAFGALQVTVSRVAPGLPEVRDVSKTLAPFRKEGDALNAQLNAMAPTDPGRKELAGKIKEQFLGKQKPLLDKIKETADKVQFRQETGGLIGRILLAVLLFFGIRRVTLLRMFQIPALIILPLTYFYFFKDGGEAFLLAYGVCGLVTVAQFSYFGEYLPKVFPVHLRGTGGSFATNVGGRMVGTSMALVTTNVLAPMLAGQNPVLPMHVAQAAGYVAVAMAVIGFITGFFLPEPQAEVVEQVG